MLFKIALSALAVFIAGFLAVASAKQLDKGWWIVVGSFSTEPSERMVSDFDKVRAMAALCRVDAFNDFSGKFRGFEPGFNVFVIGAFATRADAEGKLRTARRCFPGAYIKFGEYLGE